MKEITKDKINMLRYDICSFLEFLFCFTIGIFYLMFYNIKDFVGKVLKREKENDKT